ncbi:MAG: alpha/beta fold hydrolase [Dehalococcoidia bacterium]
MPTAKINGIDIYYEEHGDSNAEPVLLIMGFLMNAAAWAPQVPALAERYHVIALDNRGAGRTTQPEAGYTMEDMADDAAGVLGHLGIDSAHVIGLSMGGMVAQHLALRHPRRVRTLTLMVTSCGGPHSAGYETMVERRAEAQAQPPESLGAWTPEQAQEFALMHFTPEFLANPGPAFMQFVTAALQHPTLPHSMLAQGEAILAHDTHDRLPEIAAPTLVMAGDADPLIDPENSRILAKRIPGAQLRLFPGLRHGFSVERPDEVNAVVLEFLGKHAAVPA